MGVSDSPVQSAEPRETSDRRGWVRAPLRWMSAPIALRVTAIASLVVNIGIVVTGGAVRLTSSGLGCPTWPRCAGNSLVPTAAQAHHGQIEFTNRMLTWVLVIVAIVTLAVAVRQRRAPDGRGARRWKLALAIALGIPAQAVLGGFTVLTDLNPWLVGCHLLLSMALIAIAVVLLHEAPPVSRRLPSRDGGDGSSTPLNAIRMALAWLTAGAAAITLVLGVVVTGSGPHAGATNAEGVARRIGFDPQQVTQLHADAVMVLVGLTLGLAVLARFAAPSRRWARAVWALLALEAAQGAIGFIQYFAGVPPILVGLHMLGACLVWACAIWVLLTSHDGDDVDEHSDHGADDGAVDADELKVAPDLQLQPPAGLRGVPALHRRGDDRGDVVPVAP